MSNGKRFTNWDFKASRKASASKFGTGASCWLNHSNVVPAPAMANNQTGNIQIDYNGSTIGWVYCSSSAIGNGQFTLQCWLWDYVNGDGLGVFASMRSPVGRRPFFIAPVNCHSQDRLAGQWLYCAPIVLSPGQAVFTYGVYDTNASPTTQELTFFVQ